MRGLLVFLRGLVGVFGFVMASAATLAALASLGGTFSDSLDVFTHFSPFWFAGGLLALLPLALGGGSTGRVGAAVATVGIIAAAALILPDVIRAARPTAPAQGEVIKVVQFNVWGARNPNPDQTVRWILDQSADVVVLEEAYATPIVRRLEPHFAARVTCADPHPCSTVIFTRVRPLERGGLEGRPGRVPATWVTLPSPAGAYTVVGAHYTWPIPAGPQQQQRRRLAAAMEPFERTSLIVAGDFNSTPWSFSLRRQDQAFGLERRTRALFTWPAGLATRLGVRIPFPFLAIDHVYAGRAWKTVSVERGPRLGSDHHPVVVVLARDLR